MCRPAPPPPERLAPEASGGDEDGVASAEEESSVGLEEESSAGLSAEDVQNKVKVILVELYNSGDVQEALRRLKEELAEAQADLAAIVESSVIVSLEGKGTSWDKLHDLLKLAR